MCSAARDGPPRDHSRHPAVPASGVRRALRPAAARFGRALVYRDGEGSQLIRLLDPSSSPFAIGRRPSSDVCLGWDEQVSRLQAQIECVGEDWTLIDDGISRNGSFVNGERVAGRRRLDDGDTLRFGETLIAYRDPRQAGPASTVVGGNRLIAADVSEAQLRVLAALCRPLKSARTFTALAPTRRSPTSCS